MARTSKSIQIDNLADYLIDNSSVVVDTLNHKDVLSILGRLSKVLKDRCNRTLEYNMSRRLLILI